jgi:DHA1 family inner membrane transport protein
MHPRNPTPTLLTLSLGYFTMGVTSLAVVGLNVPIGRSLRVAPARVGLLVAVFAVTFAVAAPLAPALLGHLDRRVSLLTGVALLGLAGVFSALAPNYGTLALARVLGALGGAVYGPAALAVGSLIVDEEHRQRALATVFGGMTAAGVLGVPLATILGNAFGWRLAMAGVGALGVLALGLAAVLVPRLPVGERPAARAYAAVARTPGMLPTVATTLLFMAAQFVIYAVAGSYLTQRFAATPGVVSAALLGFGVLGVLGNATAGRVGDRLGGDRTVSIAVTGIAVGFAILLVAPHGSLAGLLLFPLWAFFSQLYQAPQQARLVNLVPAQRGVTLAVNASALYLGISLGSLLGSTLLPELGAVLIPPVSLVLAGLAGVAHASSARRIRLARAVPERTAGPASVTS